MKNTRVLWLFCRLAEPYLWLFCGVVLLFVEPIQSFAYQVNTTENPSAAPTNKITPCRLHNLNTGILAAQNSDGMRLLKESLNATAGMSSLSQIDITGSITVPKEKGTTETNPLVLAAARDRLMKIEIAKSSGTQSIIQSISNDGTQAENQKRADGMEQESVSHNPLLPHVAWFFPWFVMASQPGSDTNAAFSSSDLCNGVTSNHLQVWQTSEGSDQANSASVRAKSQFDLYLDPATSLPTSIVFHRKFKRPATASSILRQTQADIPVEIRYSDYRPVQGIPVPYSVDVLIQGQPIYNIRISSAVINSGIIIANAN